MQPVQDAETPEDGQSRPSGQRVIIVAFVGAVAIAVAVILAGVFLITDRDDEEAACDAHPEICEVVRRYATAFNARDSAAIVDLLTEDGLQRLLGAESQEDVETTFARLTEADRIRNVEISRVNVEGDEATAVVRFVREDEGSNAVFSLVREGGGWKIDR